MTWIETVEPAAATGELASLYEQIQTSRGGVAEVHKAFSLHPRAHKAHLELYKSVMFSRSSLSCLQRERIGAVVSQQNKCPYCVAHHLEAMRTCGAADEEVDALRDGDFSKSDAKTQVLLEWSSRLTKSPEMSKEVDIARLRQHGWEDAAILDTALVVSYFNFINRIVLGLGVNLEADFEQTCR